MSTSDHGRRSAAGTRCAASVLLSAALLGLTVPGSAQAATTCQTVHAKGVGQALGPTETTATIRGGGLLNGSTTHGEFTPTGVVGTLVSFDGTVEFATRKGTLLVTVTGSIDQADGRFESTSTGISGSDGLEGATGELTLDGVQNLVDGSFTEDVDGRVCIERGRP